MGTMKNIDIEIKNSPALSYLLDRIRAITIALDDALLQRAKDWDNIQELETQVKGLQIIAKELLTVVDLKHLDSKKSETVEMKEFLNKIDVKSMFREELRKQLDGYVLIKKETWLRLSELKEDITDVDDAINFLIDGYHNAGAVDDAIEDIMQIFADETKWQHERMLQDKVLVGDESDILNIEGVLRERLKQFLDVYHKSDYEESESVMPDSPPFDPHELD